MSIIKKCPLLKNISKGTMLRLIHEIAKPINITEETMLCKMITKKKELKLRTKRSIVMKSPKTHNVVNDMEMAYKLAEKYQKTVRNLLLESNGIYIVINGVCEVRDPDNGSIISPIYFNDYFGESAYSRKPSYESFGNIIAIGGSTMTFIPKDYLAKIPLYDKKIIIENSSFSKKRLMRVMVHTFAKS